jgi:hypothetical protein
VGGYLLWYPVLYFVLDILNLKQQADRFCSILKNLLILSQGIIPMRYKRKLDAAMSALDALGISG